MKKILISIFSLILILASCTFSPQTPTPSPEPKPDDTSWDDRSLFKDGLVQSQQPVLEELDGASVYHLEFHIAENLYHVTGHEEVRYTNTELTPLEEVQLRLFPNILGGKMDVSNIFIDEKPVSPSYDLQNSLLILPFAAPLQPGDHIVIKMDFAVQVPQTVDENYGVIAYVDDVLALAHAYPMISVYDDEGWNAEIPRDYGDVTYADASFYVVKVVAPKDLTLVATGREIDHTKDEQMQTSTVASGPGRDFFLAASPAYQEITQTFGEVTIHSYAPPEEKEAAQQALDMAAQAVQDFSRQYAPYPYTELDLVSTPTAAGGIEYPGTIVVASRVYEQAVNAVNEGAKYNLAGVVAHEVGHQWFYNLVGDDQLDEPWLDESFAQFATLQFFQDEYGAAGEEGLRSSFEARWKAVGHADIPIGLPVASYSGKEYGAIVYGRGPLFLVALKEQIGDAVFDEFLKDYVSQLAWGIATPEFMQTLAEKHCSCDLDALFNEWVYPK